jgi:hypothetical protein
MRSIHVSAEEADKGDFRQHLPKWQVATIRAEIVALPPGLELTSLAKRFER